MKLHRLTHAKKSISTFFLLLTMFVAAVGLISPRVYAEATVAVVPDTNVANPGESFIINVTITGASNLWTYGGKLGFDAAILQAVNVTEGPFLKEGWDWSGSTSFAKSIDNIFGVIDVSITRNPEPFTGRKEGASGSGTLFTVGFNVEDAGTSTLDLYDTLLLDPDGGQLDHDVSPGTFYTEVPVASFTFSPKTYGRPIVGENVTFDASASIDPDGGGILNYTWDFDDGTNDTGMIVTHKYNEPTTPDTPYMVTLNITDDDGKNNTVSREVHVKFHDIAIVDITVPEEIFWREVATINVTVLNNGSHPDRFNVTAYYNSNPINTQVAPTVLNAENETLTFNWYTYIVPQTSSSNLASSGNWIFPLNASASDDLYAYNNITLGNNTYQDYIGYKFFPAGWTGISKVEVGIEVSDLGGDDQLSIQVNPFGSIWSEEKFVSPTATDQFVWVDVTGNLSWSTGLMNNTRVRIKYIQRGGTATPIYVDWLPVRFSPRNPTDIPPGTYALWANAFLVDPVSLGFRAGEEEDTIDNTLFGDPITITLIPYRDIAVTHVEVSPTEVAYGRTATVEVEIENQGNTEETFRVELYANSTVVGNQTGVKLLSGATKTLRFIWYEATNTTVEGTYNITIYIPPVVNENDTTNNSNQTLWTMRLLPRPIFTPSPREPLIGDEVTFDASASYAPGIPGGTIDRYEWDFDDGYVASYVKDVNLTATTTHTYNSSGTYSAKLTVVDNENLNHTKIETVRVQKLNSTLSISASPTIVPISLNTTISGSISPVRAYVPVSINYTRIDDINYTGIDEIGLYTELDSSRNYIRNWTVLETVSTNENSEYSLVWSKQNDTWPQQDGTFILKAYWKGDDITDPANSSLIEVNVIIQDIAIVDVVLSKIRLTTGENLTIDVTTTNRGTATETFNVAVYYNDTLLETKTLTNLTEGFTETLSFNWDTTGVEEGVYICKAVAEPLLGETYVADNTQTRGFVIEELAETPVNIFLYTTIGLAIVTVIIAVYLVVRILRSKPK